MQKTSKPDCKIPYRIGLGFGYYNNKENINTTVM